MCCLSTALMLVGWSGVVRFDVWTTADADVALLQHGYAVTLTAPDSSAPPTLNPVMWGSTAVLPEASAAADGDNSTCTSVAALPGLPATSSVALQSPAAVGVVTVVSDSADALVHLEARVGGPDSSWDNAPYTCGSRVVQGGAAQIDCSGVCGQKVHVGLGNCSDVWSQFVAPTLMYSHSNRAGCLNGTAYCDVWDVSTFAALGSWAHWAIGTTLTLQATFTSTCADSMEIGMAGNGGSFILEIPANASNVTLSVTDQVLMSPPSAVEFRNTKDVPACSTGDDFMLEISNIKLGLGSCALWDRGVGNLTLCEVQVCCVPPNHPQHTRWH